MEAAHSQAMASARGGMMCSDGMVDRTLAAQWTEVDDAQKEAERQRQALLSERSKESNALCKANEAHRQQVADTGAAKKRILDEMRVVRGKMEEKTAAARARNNHNMGVANRSLARAGKNALTARSEAERWQARAHDVEVVFTGSAAREADMVKQVQEASQKRAAEAENNSVQRMQLGQKLLDETTSICGQVWQCHANGCQTQELHARQAEGLRMQGAESARQEAAVKVQSAVSKSSRAQLAYIEEIQKSREAAAIKVAQAQQEFLDKRMQCEALLERERICAAQARKIALTLKQQEEGARDDEVAKLEAKLDFANAQARVKVSNFEFETGVAAQRNEASASRNEACKVSAQAQVEKEEEDAISRVNQMKVSLVKLQAQCAAYIRKLLEHWDEAKKADAAKVEAASARTEEMTRFCEETVVACERYCKEALMTAEKHANAKKTQLEEKVSGMDNLAKQRVAMMLRQSRERREKAEAQLADFLAHVEDVRAQCDERVRVEAVTTDEKVEMARQRLDAEVVLAQQRQADAEARRDAARAKHTSAMARCVGAAMEARRRGLNTIAEIIEPEPPKRYPGWDTTADGVSQAADTAAELIPTTCKDGLMETGITAASTAVPDDLMATMETAKETVPSPVVPEEPELAPEAANGAPSE